MRGGQNFERCANIRLTRQGSSVLFRFPEWWVFDLFCSRTHFSVRFERHVRSN